MGAPPTAPVGIAVRSDECAALLSLDRALVLIDGVLAWHPGAVSHFEAELFDTLGAVRVGLASIVQLF